MAELHEVEDVISGVVVRIRTENGWLYCHGSVNEFRIMTFVPDASPGRTSLTQKQIKARQKNAEKARAFLERAKADKIKRRGPRAKA